MPPTWTYGHAPGTATSAQLRDQVRFLIGDRVPSQAGGSPSDDEIAALLANQSASPTLGTCYEVAIQLCLMRAAQNAENTDYKIASTSVRAGQRTEAWAKLADRLKAQATALGVYVPSELGFGAATSKAALAARAENTDLPDSIFYPSQFDHPELSNPRGEE